MDAVSLWRWFNCRRGRHYFVVLEIEGGELDGEHVFCIHCGIHAHGVE